MNPEQIDTKFNPHEWNPTMKLRWRIVYEELGDSRILQQLWVSKSGESEWRAIPTEET